MKKSMRMLISIFLAMVMTFGTASVAFAADESPVKMDWTDLRGDDYSFYLGNQVLKEGENLVTYLDSNVYLTDIDESEIRELESFCYEFEATESGYYFISTEQDIVLGVAENYDGTTASGCCDYVFYGEQPYNKIFYIEEGKTVIGILFQFDYYIVMDTLKIEFLGSEIEDYSLSEERLDDYVIGLNVWDDDSGEIAMGTDCEVTFIPEKKITMNNIYLMGTCDVNPKEGKNKATVELFGIKKDVEFTAYYLETLVESVEISNLEKHTVFSKDYRGEQHYDESSGEKITVKFNDGTEYSGVLTESSADIVLPNGADALAYAGLTLNDDGSYDFIISIGNVIFERYDVEEKENSFFENIGVISKDNFECLYKSGDDFIVGIQYIGKDNDFAMQCFSMIFEDFSQIFMNCISFIKYCVG